MRRLIIKVYIIERITRVKLLNVLRQVLFDIRARNSNLAKVLVEKVTMQCTSIKIHTDAYYPCKINKANHFSPILVTTMHKTDSF